MVRVSSSPLHLRKLFENCALKKPKKQSISAKLCSHLLSLVLICGLSEKLRKLLGSTAEPTCNGVKLLEYTTGSPPFSVWVCVFIHRVQELYLSVKNVT